MTRPLATTACHCGLVLLGRAECASCSRAALVFELPAPARTTHAPVLAFAALCVLALALLWVSS
jgi:hypothetical protein